MHEPADLPPFEMVTVDDTHHGGATRLRVRVAISPEDVDAVAKVAQAVIRQLDSDYDVIWLSFSYTAVAARAGSPAELRALYVRHDARPEHRPLPLISPHAMAEISSADGLLMVELPWFP